MELEPGTWIMPTVRLIRPLREGGMGSIWVAADMRLHTQVAVKFLSPALAADKNTRARFEREGRLARQIESPHLVHTYSQGVLPDGTPFIVMEWLEGESLNDRLGRDGQLRPQDALSVVTQVCRALQKAHEVGVIHRDVKPDNVFVLRSDRDILVKLLDFGVAKRLDDGSEVVTDIRETLGTPMYMSPEQLRHASKVDHRTDLWAVGVLAYRTLLGTPPFDAPDFPAMCRAVCEAIYEPPSRFDKRWPRALDAWFAHCFALHRDARFHSAQETASSLARALDPLGGEEPDGAIVDEETTPAE